MWERPGSTLRWAAAPWMGKPASAAPGSRAGLEALLLAALLGWGLAPWGEASGWGPARIRQCLRSDLLSRADYERMERGYYEQILDAGRTLGGSAPAPLTRGGGGPNLVCQVVTDLREVVLKPNHSVIQPVGASWSTNARGMRDRTYRLAKPPATYRIAMAGDSIGAGWGVGDALGFEPRLERLLDARSRALGGPAVEILNFAVPGRSPGQRWYHFTEVAWGRQPDLVLFEATQADVSWDRRQLARLLSRGLAWDSPLFRDVLRAAGVRPGATAEAYERALRPYDWELAAGVYRVAAADCRARGVPSVWVLLPRVGRDVEPDDHDRLLELARKAGFSAVVDLSDGFEGRDPATLTARADDYHPNARGHALLARRLDQALRRETGLGVPWTGDAEAEASRTDFPAPAAADPVLPNGGPWAPETSSSSGL